MYNLTVVSGGTMYFAVGISLKPIILISSGILAQVHMQPDNFLLPSNHSQQTRQSADSLPRKTLSEVCIHILHNKHQTLYIPGDTVPVFSKRSENAVFSYPVLHPLLINFSTADHPYFRMSTPYQIGNNLFYCPSIVYHN